MQEFESHPANVPHGHTAQGASPSWPDMDKAKVSRPNVLQIVFDDAGWSDFGCFGSSIETPNIDQLADTGLRYTNFHVTPLCSPTRAALLTGRNHHSVGMRFLTALDTGFDNSRGRVDPSIQMIPDRLRNQGFGTYLVGKWHLTPKHEITPVGPFDHWPLRRGFDRFYGFLDGCTDQYYPELVVDNTFCQSTLDGEEHLTDRLADQAISMLSDHVSFRPSDPFYMTFALGATHAPLQAPQDLIDKYAAAFEHGWDLERKRRIKRQRALGVVPDDTVLTERNPGVSPWDDLNADQRRLYARQQAVYAAFMEHTDLAIGRVVAALERLGLREDTLIMVFSDNGASREGAVDGAVDIHANYSQQYENVADQIKRIDATGRPSGPAHYPEGWAMASNTPFRRYKQLVDLGGVRAPLVVNWPNGIAEHGEIRTEFAHVIDVAATVADLSGIKSDDMHGQSLSQNLQSSSGKTRTQQYWEMFGHRAIWKDGWKAVTEHATGAAYGTDIWRLYNTSRDFSEAHDCADAHPEILADLQALWAQEAEKFGVFPLDDRPMKKLLNETGSPHMLAAKGQVHLFTSGTHIPVSTAIAHAFRPVRITVQLQGRKRGRSGLIFAAGAGHCGMVWYLDGDRIVFEHAGLGQSYEIDAELTPGAEQLELVVTADENDRWVSLLQNGHTLTTQVLPNAMRHLSFWGLDVGTARAPLITQHPAAKTAFPNGVLETVTYNFHEDAEEVSVADVHARTD